MALEEEPGLTVEGWLTSHGLRSVFEKLESHYSELPLTLQDYSSMNASEIKQLSDEIGLTSVFERVKFRQAFKSLSRDGITHSDSASGGSGIPSSLSDSRRSTTNMIFLGKKEGEIIDEINELLESVNNDLDKLRLAVEIGREDYAEKRDHLTTILDNEIMHGLQNHCLKERMVLEQFKQKHIDSIQKDMTEWSSMRSKCETSMDEFLRIISMRKSREKKTSMIHRLNKRTFSGHHNHHHSGSRSIATSHRKSIASSSTRSKHETSISSASMIDRFDDPDTLHPTSKSSSLFTTDESSSNLQTAWKKDISNNRNANKERIWIDCHSISDFDHTFTNHILSDCLCIENCLLDTTTMKSVEVSDELFSPGALRPSLHSCASAPVSGSSSTVIPPGAGSPVVPEMVISVDSTSTVDDEFISGTRLDDELLAAVDIYNEEVSHLSYQSPSSSTSASTSPSKSSKHGGMRGEPGGTVSVIESVSIKDEAKMRERSAVPIDEKSPKSLSTKDKHHQMTQEHRKKKKAMRKKQQYQSVTREPRSKRYISSSSVMGSSVPSFASSSASYSSGVSSSAIDRDQGNEDAKTDFTTMDSVFLSRSVRRRKNG